MSEVLQGDYSGTPMLIIRNAPTDSFPFQFGTKKAILILEHLPEIMAFVARHNPTVDIKSIVQSWNRQPMIGGH